MEYCVIFYTFDRSLQVQKISSVQLQGDEYKVGSKVSAEFPTTELADTGHEIVEMRRYHGVILFMSPGKKACIERKENFHAKLKTTTSIDELIKAGQNEMHIFEHSGKRGASAKLQKVLEEMKSDQKHKQVESKTAHKQGMAKTTSRKDKVKTQSSASGMANTTSKKKKVESSASGMAETSSRKEKVKNSASDGSSAEKMAMLAGFRSVLSGKRDQSSPSPQRKKQKKPDDLQSTSSSSHCQPQPMNDGQSKSPHNSQSASHHEGQSITFQHNSRPPSRLDSQSILHPDGQPPSHHHGQSPSHNKLGQSPRHRDGQSASHGGQPTHPDSKTRHDYCQSIPFHDGQFTSHHNSQLTFRHKSQSSTSHHDRQSQSLRQSPSHHDGQSPSHHDGQSPSHHDGQSPSHHDGHEDQSQSYHDGQSAPSYRDGQLPTCPDNQSITSHQYHQSIPSFHEDQFTSNHSQSITSHCDNRSIPSYNDGQFTSRHDSRSTLHHDHQSIPSCHDSKSTSQLSPSLQADRNLFSQFLWPTPSTSEELCRQIPTPHLSSQLGHQSNVDMHASHSWASSQWSTAPSLNQTIFNHNGGTENQHRRYATLTTKNEMIQQLQQEVEVLKEENRELKTKLQQLKGKDPRVVYHLQALFALLNPLETSTEPPTHEQEAKTSSSKVIPGSGMSVTSCSPTSSANSHKRPLIVDPDDPSRFDGVLVDSSKLYTLEMKAKSRPASEAAGFLLNGIIDLVFDRQILSNSCGLGLRANKDDNNRTALGQKPVQAIRDYIKSISAKHKWDPVTPRDFNKKFTYKCTNARRDK